MRGKANRDLVDPRPARHGFKTRAEAFGFAVLGATFRSLPPAAASRLGAASWRLLAPLNRRHRRAENHLRLAFPDGDLKWRGEVLREMWSNLGATFAEGFALDRLLDAPERFETAFPPDVEAHLANGGPAVLASLHSGNWEVAVAPLVRRGLRPAGIYQRVRNPLVEAEILARREGLYPGGLFRKGPSTARRALSHVKRGGIVAVMADLRDRRGIAAPFFGRPAPSTPFPALLARAGGAPLIAGRVIRLGPARFRIEAQEVKVPRTDDRDADIAEATRRLHAVFEAWVREYPGQWMWGHRRWGSVALRSRRKGREED